MNESHEFAMAKMHLWQPGFAYSACGPLKVIDRVKNLKWVDDNSRYMHRNTLDKACF